MSVVYTDATTALFAAAALWLSEKLLRDDYRNRSVLKPHINMLLLCGAAIYALRMYAQITSAGSMSETAGALCLLYAVRLLTAAVLPLALWLLKHSCALSIGKADLKYFAYCALMLSFRDYILCITAACAWAALNEGYLLWRGRSSAILLLPHNTSDKRAQYSFAFMPYLIPSSWLFIIPQFIRSEVNI